MCDVDVRWQYTGRTRAAGRTSRRERASAASVGPALASSDISELELQLFIVTARTQKKEHSRADARGGSRKAYRSPPHRTRTLLFDVSA